MRQQPLSHSNQIVRKGPKFLDVTLLNTLGVPKYQMGGHGVLVDIQTATNRMHNLDNFAIISANHGFPPRKVIVFEQQL
jgi:hypothetical protein